MDLAKLDLAASSETPFDLELVFRDKPTGLFVQVIGNNSSPVRAVSRTHRDAELKRAFELSRGKALEAPTADSEDGNAVALAVAATVGWYEKKGGKKVDGLPFGDARIAYSPEEARKLYSNPGYAWIAAQVVAAAYDIANFTKG